MGNLVGSNLWSPAVYQGAGGGAGGGGPVETLAYFYASAAANKVYKVTPAGVITIFKDYSGVPREPYGVAVDSANGRLFVMMGDTAAQFQVDRFDDLGLDSGATAAATISSHAWWGGEGRYVYSTDEVYWGPVGGIGNTGIRKVNGAVTAVTSVVALSDMYDAEYWPPDDKVYTFESKTSDLLYSGNLAGTTWALVGVVVSDGARSLATIPAGLMGGTNYFLYSDTGNRFVGRVKRDATGEMMWLDTTGASVIKIIPRCIRMNYETNHVVFVGHFNGGTGVFGLYSILIQEAAQAEGNLVLIADFNAAGIPGSHLTGQGLAIHYNSDPSGGFID